MYTESCQLYRTNIIKCGNVMWTPDVMLFSNVIQMQHCLVLLYVSACVWIGIQVFFNILIVDCHGGRVVVVVVVVFQSIFIPKSMQ